LLPGGNASTTAGCPLALRDNGLLCATASYAAGAGDPTIPMTGAQRPRRTYKSLGVPTAPTVRASPCSPMLVQRDGWREEGLGVPILARILQRNMGHAVLPVGQRSGSLGPCKRLNAAHTAPLPAG